MACFPRFFHRQKSSFSPAEDDNIDTILNDTDSSVQLGRYIHREEKPVFTPKHSERSIRLPEQQSNTAPTILTQEQQEYATAYIANHINNYSSNHSNTSDSDVCANNNNLGNNTSFTSNNINANNNNHKKFISKRSNSHYANNSNNNNSSNNNNNILATKSQVQNVSGKFKPTKERRPTALPTEAPHVEDEHKDDVNGTAVDTIRYFGDAEDNMKMGYSSATPASTTPSSTPLGGTPMAVTPTSTPTNVKFYLAEDDADKEDSKEPMDAAELTEYGNKYNAAAAVSAATALSSPTVVALDEHATSKQSLKSTSSAVSDNHTSLVPNYSGTKTTTTTAIGTASPTTKAKLRLQLPSNNGSTCNKLRLNLGSNSPRTQLHDSDIPPIYIPPPPPLPPQPLTTANSCVSLASLKSAKSRRNSSGDGNSNSNYKAQLSNPNVDTHSLNGNAKTRCTLEDVLHIKCSSSTIPIKSKTTVATKTAVNSLNARDSGVQIEDQSPTSSPKDSESSDTPKSHRLEGGLIFSRANVPLRKDVQIEFIKKDEATRDLIRKAIEKNDFLNNYMDKERKEMVINAMEPASYDKDHYIINENDEGSEIFVSEEGDFEVLKGNKVINTFGGGTVFGELAILYNAKRLASIRVATYARVWKIEREKFRNIMVISGSKEREENLHFLRSAPFLSDLEEEVLDKVVDLLQRKFYETDTSIVREGEVGNDFFIIRGGTVTIKKLDETGLEHVVARRKRGDYFGEQALLNADRRQATVYADPPGTEVLKLDRESFISYLGTIPELHEKPGERQMDEAVRESSRRSEFDNEYAHIKLTELKKIATLGAGAFGRVDLVSYAQKTFALKIIKKIDIVKQDQVDHVYSEKHVMMKCRSSPFIIELYKTYRNEKFVYFLMEACMGGDVWTVMSQRRFFDEKTAKFIAGCVVEAFDFLHAHNIIYRDLKPENLMLSTDGYCKLVDFGFAKHIPPNQKTNTFAGTPEYVAPEIILDRGHDRAVDYWALGILIFELLVGRTPFRGQNQIKIYQQILGGIDVIQMPSKIPKSAQGLIKHLCKQLPAERLGYQRRGIHDIKRHSWFDSLDWHKLKTKHLVSPIKRPLSSPTDLQYFGPSGVENDHDPPDETSGWDIDF